MMDPISAIQCSAVQSSAVQCSAVQCRAVQCSAAQCSAVLRSAASPCHLGVRCCWGEGAAQEGDERRGGHEPLPLAVRRADEHAARLAQVAQDNAAAEGRRRKRRVGREEKRREQGGEGGEKGVDK